jgi:hypothetical protein
MSTLKVDDIQSRQSTDDAISLASDSSVSLKHSASAKLTTTSTGVSVTGTCTATTFSGSGASLTSLPAANLTGTLPAIDGSALTGMSTTHPAWFGKLAANQSISNVTWETITNLTDASVNPSSNSGGWDSSTGVYTVQSGQAGIYYAFGGFKLDDLQAQDVVSAGISKNDATPSPSSYNRQDYGSHYFQYTSMAQIFSLAVGDTLRFKVYHNEGTSENAVADETHFGGFRIFAT